MSRDAIQRLFQGLTFDELHHDEVDTFSFFDRVNGNDVWMIKGGSGLGLFQKATLGVEVIVRGYG